MPYDPKQDAVLKKWECPETGLVVSINRYGSGEAKVQVGPRMIKKKGKMVRHKAGRLTMDDIVWLMHTLENVKAELAYETDNYDE